jgi:hypothetical protein
LYFIPGMIDDYSTYFGKIAASEEIKYKITVGMDRPLVLQTIKNGYGRNKQKIVFVESLLSLFILLFFTIFCMNTKQFNDYLGVSRIISFENIFTKLFWAEADFSGILRFHVVILALIYLIVLVFIQKRKKV